VVEIKNTTNGREKMHAKLLYSMDQRPTELKGCTNHTKPWCGEHMEYDGMSGNVVYQDGKHQWYLLMQSMSKFKEEKTVMLKTLAP
jgi:hypothetical protein